MRPVEFIEKVRRDEKGDPFRLIAPGAGTAVYGFV
jgi:hypothetical protein